MKRVASETEVGRYFSEAFPLLLESSRNLIIFKKNK